MSWRIIIRPNAEADLQEAQAWYESQRAGLGIELLDEIRHAVGSLEITLNAARCITVTFAGCSRAGFPINFSTASKMIRSLFSVFSMRNGNISGDSRNSRRDVRATVEFYKIWKERLAEIN